MGIVRNLFRKAVEIDILDRQNAILAGEVAKLKFERDANAKQVIAERNKRDKDNQQFNKALLQLAGGKHQLLQEPLPLEEPKEPELTERQLAGIRALAQETLDNDIASGIAPLSLEQYEQMILAKGDEYLPIIVE